MTHIGKLFIKNDTVMRGENNEQFLILGLTLDRVCGIMLHSGMELYLEKNNGTVQCRITAEN